ncbi:MAG: GNAT family N-acetyltransferase [Actinomycetota bacterium]|nr:GNAT family N-acetyltransferase [Actinomycetota bacterium]
MIRTATANDIDAVLALWDTSGPPSKSLPDTEAGVLALLDRDPGALLLAEDDGAVVGTVVVTFDGWRCYMYRMAVAHSHRRRGIGRALVAAAEARIRDLGGVRADALTLTDDEAARAFWHSVGYEPDNRLTRWGKLL